MNPDNRPTTDGERLTRRRTIARLGGLVAGSVGAAGLEAALSDSAAGAGDRACCRRRGARPLRPHPRTDRRALLRRRREAFAATSVRAGRASSCTLRTTVVDASTCKPIKARPSTSGIATQAGNYSGVNGATTRSSAGSSGRTPTASPLRHALSRLVPGRTTHIHVKVHLGGTVVHTGQLYFPESAVTAVARRAPYSGRGAPETRNADDAIYRNGGKQLVDEGHAGRRRRLRRRDHDGSASSLTRARPPRSAAATPNVAAPVAANAIRTPALPSARPASSGADERRDRPREVHHADHHRSRCPVTRPHADGEDQRIDRRSAAGRDDEKGDQGERREPQAREQPGSPRESRRRSR